MINLFNIFKKKNKNDLYKDGKLVAKSSITYSKSKQRFLKLDDQSCAIVLHKDNNVEVIFTKLYDTENQNITSNQQALMALGMFIKQPGFLEMLVNQFRKIAMERITNLTENTQNEGKK